MTRGSNRKRLSPKKVLSVTCLKALVFQLYIVTTSLLTCTIHSALVAMSPPGGKTLPPVVCDSFVLATWVNSVTVEFEGGAAAGCCRTAPGFVAATFLAAT